MEHFGTDSMLFPIWPNGLAQTLVAIKRLPLILSKGLDGFTVLLQTAGGVDGPLRALTTAPTSVSLLAHKKRDKPPAEATEGT